MRSNPLTAPLGTWSLIGITYHGDRVCCGAHISERHHGDCPTTAAFARLVEDAGDNPLAPEFWQLWNWDLL